MSHPSFSPLIAGTMTWGSWGKNLSSQSMSKLIELCMDHGINTFDHADIYGDYTTESSFGEGLKHGGIERSSIRLISKCGIQLPSETRGTRVKHYDYAMNHIIQSVDASLKNLKTEYLDLLLLHRPSPLMNAEHIAEAIENLKEQGKIMDFGLSNFSPSQTQLIQTKNKVSSNQIEFSLTHLDPMTDGSLDFMQVHSIRPMAWSPLGSVFSGSDERSLRINELVAQLAPKYGVPMDVLLLAWILKHPAGILPVFGTTEPTRISRLMEATRLEWELQDWFLLWATSSGRRVP